MAAVENATDDGRLNSFLSEGKDNAKPDDNDWLGDFPYWPWVRMGRTELPNEPLFQPFYPWRAN